jgi:putative DNA primase/helicase
MAGSRSQVQTVVERLLTISGEDLLSVPRKNREDWTGTLPARLMLCSNELPHLPDASTAIVTRFVPMMLTESFYGCEDIRLQEALNAELSGILNWALDGLERLTAAGRFAQCPQADAALRTMEDLASPERAFARDQCILAPNESVPSQDLYRAFCVWVEQNGARRISDAEFGRNLFAAFPGRVRGGRAWSGDGPRPRSYIGIGLRKAE